jgi:hypothetical protein
MSGSLRGAIATSPRHPTAMFTGIHMTRLARPIHMCTCCTRKGFGIVTQYVLHLLFLFCRANGWDCRSSLVGTSSTWTLSTASVLTHLLLFNINMDLRLLRWWSVIDLACVHRALWSWSPPSNRPRKRKIGSTIPTRKSLRNLSTSRMM